MSNQTKALILVVIGAGIAGATSTVTKIGLLDIPPFTFSFLRFLIASAFILPFFLKKRTRFDKSFLPLIGLSMLATLNVICFVLGVRITTASISSLMYAGTPILTGAFSFLFLGERISQKKWLFILLGLLGVVYVILLPILENDAASGNIWGNFLLIVAVSFWSLYIVLSKKYQKKYSLIEITGTFIFLSTLVFFVLSASEQKGNISWWYTLSIRSWSSILYLSLLTTVGGYLINQYKIKLAGPLVAALTFYLSPLVGYFSAMVLLGEKISSGLLFGTILVLISITLTTYSK